MKNLKEMQEDYINYTIKEASIRLEIDYLIMQIKETFENNIEDTKIYFEKLVSDYYNLANLQSIEIQCKDGITMLLEKQYGIKN